MKRLSMSEIFLKHGTDKTTYHDYGPTYDRLFPDRAKVRAVLEIGVWQGASLRAWKEAFPHAMVVGLDRNPEHCPNIPGIPVYLGDQGLREDLLRAAQGTQWDLVVDDGSHVAADQLFSLMVLWPLLAPGGRYVVEEWDMLPTFKGIGVAPWRESFDLLKGCELVETTDRQGNTEVLVVITK